MRLHLCGVRGSTPAPGPDFVRYGGHTSCVAISHAGEAPTLLLDAGTGIRRVWELTGVMPFDGSILIGHLHWDHTHGLPFFRAGDHLDARVDVYVPAQDGRDALDLLGQSMSPPAFPIGPDQLQGDWRFHTLEPGDVELEGFAVRVREIPHKGGRTFGFRVSDDTRSVAYLSDHHPFSLGIGPDGFGPYHDAALELCTGADVLLHDAQYTRLEWDARSHFGHSAVDYAVGLAETCGVGRLLLFHHDPARTDDELDKLLERTRAAHPGIDIDAAREAAVVDLGVPVADR